MSAVLKPEVTTRLIKQGNSTALTLSKDVLSAAGLERGDSVVLQIDRAAGTITVRKADDVYSRAMAIGRHGAVRYRRALAALAK